MFINRNRTSVTDIDANKIRKETKKVGKAWRNEKKVVLLHRFSETPEHSTTLLPVIKVVKTSEGC